MARTGQLRFWRRWTPPWWGNDLLPSDDQFWFEVQGVGLLEGPEWRRRMGEVVGRMQAGIEEARSLPLADALAHVDGALKDMLDQLLERVRGPYNLIDEQGQAVDLRWLLGQMTPSELGQLRAVLEVGVLPDEGKDSAPPSGE